jgi:hypothetical protein
MRAADATARSRRTASTASSGLGLCGARAENTKGGRSQAKQSKAKQSRSVIQVPWRKKLSTRHREYFAHAADLHKQDARLEQQGMPPPGQPHKKQ